jgi:4-amino-4-deoxy-L-arabinose transferase-like glycosyltransferase
MRFCMDQDASRTLPVRATLLLLALTLILLLFRAGAVPLLGPDEPRYARVAVEMSRSGDLVTPTLQGRPWMEKPILYYWIAAGAFRILGENEMAARLPANLGAMLFVLATAIVGARLYDSRAGLLAGFIAATSVLPFVQGRAASMDMLLAATLTAGIGLLALRRLGLAGPAATVAAAAFLGLATLAKGPLGLLLAVLVLGAHLLLARDAVRPRAFELLAAAAVFVVVAAPWYVLIYLRQGQAFIDTFFLDHNVQRFTSTVHKHPGPFYYYLPVLLIGFFPWSGLLLPALGRVSRRSPADLFLLCWALVPFAFFSVAGSKLPGYILPIVAPLAVLMARGALAIEDREPLPTGLGATGTAAIGLVLGFAVFGASAYLLWTAEPGALSVLPIGLWALLLSWVIARVIHRSPSEALRSLRVGAPGLLALVLLAVPPLLAERESGRELFRVAGGREVLSFRAWRTAWMSGYFYNDARVREVTDPAEIVAAAQKSPTLVLCGPEQQGELQWTPGIRVKPLAQGPTHGRKRKRDVLLEVTASH